MAVCKDSKLEDFLMPNDGPTCMAKRIMKKRKLVVEIRCKCCIRVRLVIYRVDVIKKLLTLASIIVE